MPSTTTAPDTTAPDTTTPDTAARDTTGPSASGAAATIGTAGSTRRATRPGGASRATYLRRRLVAVGVLLVLAFLVTVAIGRVGAEAELADPVAGHVVVGPGETLWDVAVATAPDGVDARQQLADLRELNGTDGDVDAWTTLLVPAR